MHKTSGVVICVCFFVIGLIYSTNLLAWHTKLNTSYPTKDVPALMLGNGYLTYDHMSLTVSPIKLDNAKVYYTGLQSSILLDDTIDLTHLAKVLNIDISASGGWGNFSLNAAANYLHHIEDDKFHENFAYTEAFFADAVLDIRHLPSDISALQNEAIDIYTKKGIVAFTNHYGDTYIQQLPMGAYLIVNLRLSFSKAVDKERFDGAISGKFGSIFSASGKIKYAVDQTNVKGSIEISAYQLGGDPSELANIFAKKSNDGYYITQCSLADLTACQGALNGIIRYAQVDFKTQIKMNGDGTPSGHLEVVGEPSLTTYSNRFLLQPAPPLDPNVVGKRLELATIFNTLKSNKKFFDHFTNSPVANYFTPAANVILNNIKTSLDWNWSLFNQFRAINCYIPGEETECGTIVENIKNFTKPIDQASIDYYVNNGYAEINSSCIYVPVGAPNLEFQSYAYACQHGWLNGSFIFNFSNDRNTLSLNSDWLSDEGHHMQLKVSMKADSSYQKYSGLGAFHDLSAGLWYYKTVSVKLTQNKAYR